MERSVTPRSLPAIFAGLALSASAFTAAAAGPELLANGGFENIQSSWSVSGWSYTDFFPYKGNYSLLNDCAFAACLNPTMGAQASQEVATVAGQTYRLSFYYRTTSTSNSPFELQALISNGTPIGGGAGTCSGSCVFQTETGTTTWTQVTRTYVATSSTTRITFLGRNDLQYLYIDDVSFTLEPAPATVPTLTEWAMILMGMALAGAAALTLNRRRQVR